MSMSYRPISRPKHTRAKVGNMPIESTYTAGIAGERFLLAIRDEGKLLGSRCQSCGEVYGPPRMFCEKTLEPMTEWVEIGPEGTVKTFTVLHEGLDGSVLDVPDVLAAIQLDGADTVMIHRLDPAVAADAKIGMKVAPVFKPQGEREGSITDIEFFKPV